MAFRRHKFLECFYCGRKSAIRYDGQRSFECLSCDAMNYLDEHGDITDPPASVIGTNTPSKVTYAVSRTVSPPSRPSGSIFCDTCLNNQRLFTSSIAQYLPDDPDAPDYGERERQYYEFRKRLERIYPQICAECEPKVQQRIAQSAYTAKADVLRRMIDQSKTNKILTKRSWLDVFYVVGRWLWRAGLVLEIMSHVLGLSQVGLEYCASQENAIWGCSLLRSCGLPVLKPLPAQISLLRWSFYASLFGCWWNPRFVQTVRGFTKHLVGLPNWYAYQMMLLCIRFFSLKFFGAADPRTTATEVGAHLLAIFFAIIISRFATSSIRVDTTPLFGAKSRMEARPIDPAPPIDEHGQVPASNPDGVKNMSDLLDEILQSPTTAGAPPRPQARAPPDLGNWGSGPRGNPFAANKATPQLQTLSLSQAPPSQNHFSPPPSVSQANYDEEMDWSPTASKHRAFSSFRQPGPDQQGFSQAPTEEKKGAFWYHVPPAPIPPAHRLLNPPNQPRLRNIPASAAARPGVSFAQPRSPTVYDDKENEQAEGPRPVSFAGPSFFSPVSGDDPRNTLAEDFSRGFTLTTPREEQRSWLGGLFGSRK